MDQEEIESLVREIVAEELGEAFENVTIESNFVEDFGVDSADMVSLVMELEDEFGISITDTDAEACKTVGDAIRLVKSRLDND